MKYFIATVLLTVCCAVAFGEEKQPPYPLQIELKTFPDQIYYGDPLFVSVTMKNDGPLKIAIGVDPRAYWGYGSWYFSLRSRDNSEELFHWEHEEEFFSQESTTAIMNQKSEQRIFRVPQCHRAKRLRFAPVQSGFHRMI